MLGLLSGAGYKFTKDPGDAETIIINTCAFINDAKTEAIDKILEMAEFKKRGSCKQLVVTGCLPQRYKDELLKSMPEVDIFVGAGEFHNIVSILRDNKSKKLFIDIPKFLYDHKTPRIRSTPAHLAYIKIAEGCSHPCSFCMIPKVRGKYRSREVNSVLKEAERLIACNVKELNLIAQDSTSYGSDLKGGGDITNLLKKLSLLDGEKWIRLFYAYPKDFPAGLIELMKDSPDICRYLDLPIQHINDRILSSMQRGYKSSDIYKMLDLLREKIPNLSLRSSLIVGYPGEKDSYFEELLGFVSYAKFEHLGVFKYSDEEETRSSKLKGKIPEGLIDRRYDEIMRLQQEISFDRNRSYLNKFIQVLVDEVDEKGIGYARHMGQAPEIDGRVQIKRGRMKAGEFALVVITGFSAYDLEGEIISPANVMRNMR